MTRFNTTLKQTLARWTSRRALLDVVYAALDPYKVNMVGGRAPGIGATGFTLGGGMCAELGTYIH